MDEVPLKSTAEDAVTPGHELSDARIRPLAIFLAILAASLVIVGALVAWLFQAYLAEAERADPPPSPLAQPAAADAPATPGPLLQVSPQLDLETLRAREERRLHATEWADQPRGIVRIPIDQAIALTAERGFPDWPTVEVAPPAQDDAEAQP